MQGVKRWCGVAISASCELAMAMASNPAYADGNDRHVGPDAIQVAAQGPNGPFEIPAGPGRTLYVTESDIGQITAVDPVSGSTQPVITGVAGATGAVKIGSQFAILTGEPATDRRTPRPRPRRRPRPLLPRSLPSISRPRYCWPDPATRRPNSPACWRTS